MQLIPIIQVIINSTTINKHYNKLKFQQSVVRTFQLSLFYYIIIHVLIQNYQPKIVNSKQRININNMKVGENKIYYKGNPYTSKNYVPDSGLKNRTKPNYLVQLPQGQQYFTTGRKKQYTNLHHQSQIKQIGIFQSQQPNYLHGTYQVSDIQGATPNSLLSQAIKNRMRGHINSNQRSVRPSRAEYKYNNQTYNSGKIKNDQQVNEYEQQKRQLERRSQLKNFHLVQNSRVQTQPTNLSDLPRQPNKIQYRDGYRQNPQARNYVNQAIQTPEFRIRNLEEDLFVNQHNRLKDYNKHKNSLKTQPQIQNQYDYSFANNNNGNQNYNSVNNVNIKNDTRMQQSMVHQQSESRAKKMLSVQDLKQMWHGDHHRLLYPARNIRKFNPTYLSSQNFADTNQKYNQYFLPKIN